MMFEDPGQWLFWTRKVVAALVQPPLLPLLPIGLALLILKRHPRLARWLGWSGVLLQLALALPLTVDLLERRLERWQPPDAAAIAEARAIVVIGAGRRSHAPEYGPGATLSALSLERVRYAAWLARRSGLPVLASGGAPDGGAQPEADLMRAVLEREFRVPVRWVESASRTTRENARFSAAMLSGAGIRSILLVTHAAHMGRASEEFEAAGLKVIPAPTGWLSRADAPALPSALLPGPQSIYAGWLLVHESLGRLAAALEK